MFAKNKNTSLVIFWIKLKQLGYTRSCSSLYHQLRKLNLFKKRKSNKRRKLNLNFGFPKDISNSNTPKLIRCI